MCMCHLYLQSARANVNMTISAEVVSLPPVTSSLPWRLVRVDVKNLSVQVLVELYSTLNFAPV